MPDEVGTEATPTDTPTADDSLFGDATADDKPAAAVEGEDSTGQTEQDGQGSDDATEQDAKAETAEDEQDAGDTGEESGSSDDLKVVVSIKGGRAVIGVQKPSADPYIETFHDLDVSGLAQEVPGVTERARARWEDSPTHPAYERPAPPAKRRQNRRQQGAAQDAASPEAETQESEAQQPALQLF